MGGFRFRGSGTAPDLNILTGIARVNRLSELAPGVEYGSPEAPTPPPPPTLEVLTLSADTPVVNVGGEVVLTVTISAAAATGANQVQISSDGPAYSPTLPQTITIADGQTTGSITLTGAGSYAVGTLTAAGVGGVGGNVALGHEVSDVMVGATILPEGLFAELATTPASTSVDRRFQMLRATYDATGNPVLRKEVGYVNRRRPQPGVLPEAFGGTFASTPAIDLDDQVTLGTIIYAEDQIPGAAANNSTRTDKPLLQIRFLSHFDLSRPLGDIETFQVAVLSPMPVRGYHAATIGVRIGNGVTEVEGFQSISVPYNCPVTGLVGEVYEVTVDLSSLDDGDVVTVAADAYSWHGNVQSTDALTGDHNIRNGSGTFDILKHEDIKSNPVIAFLSDIPGGTPQASTDAAVARANPYAHTMAGMRAALEAARVINNARTDAINGCDGTRIFLTYATTPQTDLAAGGTTTAVIAQGSGFSVISDDVAYPTGIALEITSSPAALVRATGTGGLLTPTRWGLRVEGFATFTRTSTLLVNIINGILRMVGRGDGTSAVDHVTPTSTAQYMAGNNTCLVFQHITHQNLSTGNDQTWFSPGIGDRNIVHLGCAATFNATGNSSNFQCVTVIGCRFPNGRPLTATSNAMGMFVDSSEIVGSPSTALTSAMTVNLVQGSLFNRSLLFQTATNGDQAVWNISADSAATAANNVKFTACTCIAQVEGRANAWYVDASGDTRVQLFGGFGPGSIVAIRWPYKDDRGGTATTDTADQMVVRQFGGAMIENGVGQDGVWFAISWTNATQRVKSVGYGSTAMPPTDGTFVDPGFVALNRGSVGVAADPASDVRLLSDGAAVGGVEFLNGAPFRWDAYGNAPVAGTPGYRHDLEVA